MCDRGKGPVEPGYHLSLSEACGFSSLVPWGKPLNPSWASAVQPIEDTSDPPTSRISPLRQCEAAMPAAGKSHRAVPMLRHSYHLLVVYFPLGTVLSATALELTQSLQQAGR